MSIEELLEYVRECQKPLDCCSCKYNDDCRGIMHLLGRVEIVLGEVLQNGMANN